MYRAFIISTVAYNLQVLLQGSLYYTTFYQDLFAHYVGVEKSKNEITGILTLTAVITRYLIQINMIALNLTFSFEIIDIIKNPFSANIGNRKRKYWLLMTFMTFTSPLIFYLHTFFNGFFIKRVITTNSYEIILYTLVDMYDLFKIFEALIMLYTLFISYAGIFKRQGIN